MDIGKEIKQKEFSNEFQKTHINILFTASWITQRTANVLKPFKISQQQFNILRILKGQDPKPATVKLLSARMIDRMSNASRLVDKLENKGLVNRTKNIHDGRQVDILLTTKGKKILTGASEAVLGDINQCFHQFEVKEAELLNSLLDKLRNQ